MRLYTVINIFNIDNILKYPKKIEQNIEKILKKFSNFIKNKKRHDCKLYI